MDEQVKRLRAAVSALGPRVRGRRIPSSVHAQAVAFATRGREHGQSWEEMSRECGLSAESLRRWTQAPAKSAPARAALARSAPAAVAPVAVRVKPDVPAAPAALVAVTAAVSRPASLASSLVLVSPRGYRLEGLGLNEARVLLEALS